MDNTVNHCTAWMMVEASGSKVVIGNLPNESTTVKSPMVTPASFAFAQFGAAITVINNTHETPCSTNATHSSVRTCTLRLPRASTMFYMSEWV